MSNYLKKKLIVIMEYQGRKVIENIAQYKQIKYIKEVAKTAFCILNPKISLYYQHKDITENEEKLVGDYFKKKNQITIKIVSGKVNQGNNINNNKKEGKNTVFVLEKEKLKCPSCRLHYIENYCRSCKQFICNNCREDQFHESHKLIQINIDNLIDSVRLYAITLQSEILSNVKSAREFLNKHKEKTKSMKNHNIDERYKIIQDKYNKILDIYNQLINDIELNEKNINEDEKNKIDILNIILQKDKRTTLMIKNIPNKYTINLFLDEINIDFKDKYDIFYLPIDYENKCNLGFAFINFVESLHIIEFYDLYRGKKWKKFNSEKICELVYAKFQGKKELINHFEKGKVLSFECEEKRPLILPTPNPLPKISIPIKYLELFKKSYPFVKYSIIINKNDKEDKKFILHNFFSL